MEKMIDGEWVDVNTKVMTTILLCLKDEVSSYVMHGCEIDCGGLKLESRYMFTHLTNELNLKPKLARQ